MDTALVAVLEMCCDNKFSFYFSVLRVLYRHAMVRYLNNIAFITAGSGMKNKYHPRIKTASFLMNTRYRGNALSLRTQEELPIRMGTEERTLSAWAVGL